MADLEVLVISLAPEPPIMEPLRALFPQARRWPATDLRGRSPDELLAAGLVDIQAAHVLRLGRKHRWELGTGGAVGLHVSVLQALLSATAPLLLLEEDCSVDAALPRQLAELAATTFDAAVFSPRFVQDASVVGAEHVRLPHVPGLPCWVRSQKGVGFEGTHCVHYSAPGRRRVAELLRLPVRLQYDSLLALHGAQGDCDLLLQRCERGTTPRLRISSVQTLDPCLLCELPAGWAVVIVAGLALLLFLFLLVTLRRLSRAATCLR